MRKPKRHRLKLVHPAVQPAMETALEDPPERSVPMLDRFLNGKMVEAFSGFGRTVRTQKIAAGEFPRPILIAGRHIWLGSEIAAWQQRVIAESRRVA